MRVRRFADAAGFLDVAGAFLLEREAMNNVLVGIASSSKADPKRFEGRNYFAAVLDGDRVVGAALMTPPHCLLISSLPVAAVDALVADVAADGWNPPGVSAPTSTSDAFAAAWRAARGGRAVVHMDMRAFESTAVIDAPATSGRMRPAGAADDALVGAWFRAFYEEGDLNAGAISPEENARRTIRDGRVFLWDDGGPVAQAVLSATTPNGARIGGVYTPTANRRRGYATALVAEVSRAQFAAGRKFCFLFTDLANPTSNSIYPKVGYRAFADFREYDFVAAP
jgi:RimJ/RimL family protein N-acetyltransferase